MELLEAPGEKIAPRPVITADTNPEEVGWKGDGVGWALGTSKLDLGESGLVSLEDIVGFFSSGMVILVMGDLWQGIVVIFVL